MGFAPIRIAARDKNPIGKAWQKAPIDADAVDAWLDQGGNVGLRMGVQPDGRRLLAIDQDKPDAITKAEAELGALPDTLTAITGGGGRHKLFAWPADLPWPKNAVRVRDGIDVRGEGAQIVVWPSVHPSGGRYDWERTGSGQVAELPRAWCDALLASKTRGTRKATTTTTDDPVRAAMNAVRLPGAPVPKCPAGVAPEAHAVTICKTHEPAVEGSGGQGRLLGLARALVTGVALDPDAASAIAWTEYNPRCEPPWADEQRGEFDRKFAEAHATPDPGGRARGYLLLPPPAPAGVTPELVGDARGSQFWFRRGADNAYFSPVAKGMLPARAREAGAQGGSAEDIAERATIAELVVRDFGASGIRWEADELAVVQGYSLPKNPPVFEGRVDAWLRALAGERYDLLAQWFGSCTQEHAHLLAACLVVVGDTGLGKSLLGTIASRLWGASSPVSLGHAIDKFNVSITKCPIVLDDEATRMKQGDVSTSAFREMLSARERTYEPKGVDKRELRGCQRFMITCNAFSDLRFSDLGSSAVVEALADRLLVVTVPRGEPTERVRKALDALRLKGSDDVDVDVIDRHMAWVVSQTAIKPQRFLASSGRDDGEARRAILDGIVQQHPELFDGVREAVERGELEDLREPPPVFVHGGLVWVRGDRAGGVKLTAGQVYGALSPWALEPRRDVVKLAGNVVRARAHDLERLRGAL